MRKNFELKRQITEVSESELATTTRVEINLMPSKRAETFQESNSVYIVFGSKRSLNVEGRQDNLAVAKEDTLAKQSNNDRYKQSEDIDGRHDFDGEDKFVDDDDSSEEKLEDFVSLRECKRFSIRDSLDTDDPLQMYKRN